MSNISSHLPSLGNHLQRNTLLGFNHRGIRLLLHLVIREKGILIEHEFREGVERKTGLGFGETQQYFFANNIYSNMSILYIYTAAFFLFLLWICNNSVSSIFQWLCTTIYFFYIWSVCHIIALFSFYITFFILAVVHLFSLPCGGY